MNSFGFGTLMTSTHGHGCWKKLDTRQSKIHLMYRSISNLPIPPPGKPPGIWLFWKISVKCPTTCMCQFRWSNAPPVRASRRVKSPTLQACYHRFRWYATLENNAPAETFPKFPSVLRVIDRSDRNPPITATSLTFRPSLRHASGLWWISIRSVDNIYDWRKFWKRFRGYFVFESRVSTKTVVSNCAKTFSTCKTVY